MLAIMAAVAPGEAFMQWGWRIPFLFSIILIVVGYYIRHGVEESPVFKEIAARAQQTKQPVGVLFKNH